MDNLDSAATNVPKPYWGSEWADRCSSFQFLHPLSHRNFISSKSFPTVFSYYSLFSNVILVTFHSEAPFSLNSLIPVKPSASFPSLMHKTSSHWTFHSGRKDTWVKCDSAILEKMSFLRTYTDTLDCEIETHFYFHSWSQILRFEQIRFSLS